MSRLPMHERPDRTGFATIRATGPHVSLEVERPNVNTRGGTRTRKSQSSGDFESPASTDSATRARREI